MKNLLKKIANKPLMILFTVALLIGTVTALAQAINSLPVPATWASPTTGNYIRFRSDANVEIRKFGETNVGIGTNTFTGFTGNLLVLVTGGATNVHVMRFKNGFLVGTNSF